jgi:hypothetical protein
MAAGVGFQKETTKGMIAGFMAGQRRQGRDAGGESHTIAVANLLLFVVHQLE